MTTTNGAQWSEVAIPSNCDPKCEYCGRKVSVQEIRYGYRMRSRCLAQNVGGRVRWACDAECARGADAEAERYTRELEARLAANGLKLIRGVA